MLNSLIKELESCQHSDAFRLARKIRELENAKLSEAKRSAREKNLKTEIEKSQARCLARASGIPKNLNFPTELPVSGRAEEIAALLKQHQVIVIAGDTGSGKTTQIPKICLQAGFGRRGVIGHTQPRRLAAVSVANRIAEEMHSELGKGVGYQIRFNETVSERTYLKLMTDGILLAEIQNDKFLNKYEVLIIDEAHERSLNIDFLLGFFRQLLRKRTELKVIITSATIDVEKFSQHFNDAPIVSVSGRTYPVETRYQPLELQSDEPRDQLQTEGIIAALNSIVESDYANKKISGDTLVFLSSEREIRETAIAIRKRKFPHTEVLPLYSRLRQAEQLKIFAPHSGRRVVLATNVAETSITVPGIKYVIDSGFARISRYSLQSKVQRLPIEAVSQASANQRQGRCGRVSDGICIRLYTEEDFNNRPQYTDPEIKRTNLASVILQMLMLRLGDVEKFPYLDPPEQKAINDGFKLLVELNAISSHRKLTDVGKQMARLPIDPKLSRMLVIANTQACLEELLVIVSALSIQDPREISTDNRQRAQEKLSQFNHQDSDFLSLLNLWKDYEAKRQSFSQNQLKKHCKSHFLSFMRMREWREVHRQLRLNCQQLGYKFNKEPGTYEAIHKAIIAGGLNQIATKFDAKTYSGTRNKKFSVFSSSVVAKSNAKWIVTGELIETTQTFASMAAKIQPQWIESMALHLVKREYFEPHWSTKNQSVMAYEKVHLHGLTIIEKSLVSFANIDPQKAADIFIREGLAAQGIKSTLAFVNANKELLATLAKEEEKLRRPELFVGEREVVAFYSERLPSDVNSTKKLESWHRKVAVEQQDALYMSRANILSKDAEGHRAHFPDQTPISKNTLTIDYVFKPGSERDGATIEIPAPVLNQIQQTDIDWAVPGLLREKCIVLLKGLPKSLRKQLIPISGLVDEVLPLMNPQDGLLVDALIAQISVKRGVQLRREDLADIVIPKHLSVKIKVVDDSGKEVGFAENLGDLKNDLVQTRNDATTIADKEVLHPIQRTAIKDWEIDELPEQVEIGSDLVLIRYPAFVDREDSVDIQLFIDKKEAITKNRKGLVRLLMLRSVAQRNLLKKRFAQFSKQNALLIPPFLNLIAENSVYASYVSAFRLNQKTPTNKNEFEMALEHGKANLYGAGEKIAESLSDVLRKRFELLKQIRSFANGKENQYFVKDIEQQIDNLMTEKLFLDSSIEWFAEYPRYFKAIESRLSKAPHLGHKDRDNSALLQAYWHKYENLLEQRALEQASALDELRWMIEEFRVSLFAQALGTKMPVSVKRLDKQLDLIRA